MFIAFRSFIRIVCTVLVIVSSATQLVKHSDTTYKQNGGKGWESYAIQPSTSDWYYFITSWTTRADSDTNATFNDIFDRLDTCEAKAVENDTGDYDTVGYCCTIDNPGEWHAEVRLCKSSILQNCGWNLPCRNPNMYKTSNLSMIHLLYIVILVIECVRR